MIRNDYGKNMPMGWVVARKMIDEDGKWKWFTYYPRESHGVPPLFGKTRGESLKNYSKQEKEYYKKRGNKLGEYEEILPTSKVIYLDRY